MKKTLTICVIVGMMLAVSGVASATGELIGVDFDNGGGSPTNWTTLTEGPTPSATDLINEAGQTTSVDISLSLSVPLTFKGYSCVPIASTIPSHTNNLTQIGDYFYEGPSSSANATFSDLLPNFPYNVWVFGLRSFNFDNVVTITGSGTPISFRQLGSANTLFVNGELGDSNRDLSTFAELVWSSVDGTIDIGWELGPSGTGNSWAMGAVAIEPVPEPATICLLGLGALSLLRRKR
jgi:hypothetical protein